MYTHMWIKKSQIYARTFFLCMQVVKGQDGGVRDDYFDKRPLEFYMKDHVAKSELFVLKDTHGRENISFALYERSRCTD